MLHLIFHFVAAFNSFVYNKYSIITLEICIIFFSHKTAFEKPQKNDFYLGTWNLFCSGSVAHVQNSLVCAFLYLEFSI